MEDDEHRWTKVHALTESMAGLPPIEVYQLGEVYFVRDGNHRVSVARDHGLTHIEAYVTEVDTPVPLTPDIQPDDLIIKERYARFLERTRLNTTYPDLDLSMSAAGNYRVLERQISVHQYWVKEKKEEDITYEEAAVRWYKYIYLRVIRMIRERGLMLDFPERTETDLYVWIHKHRHELAESLGWSVDAETAVADFAAAQSEQSQNILTRIGKKINETLTPDVLSSGPPPGVWRESLLENRQEDRLFSRILTAVNGKKDGWQAMEQALRAARFEQGKLFGLHVIAEDEDEKSAQVEAVKAEFFKRCKKGNVAGEFSVETGQAAQVISDRARWTDLVVVSLAHPPGPQPVQRLNSQFRQLLRQSPRPVLAVPRAICPFNKLLLAYDGSPKAKEALYVAAYLTRQWEMPLMVVTVLSDQVTEETVVQAREYLQEQQIEAAYVQQAGDPAQIILEQAKAEEISLIVMGGYGQSPLVEVVLGSVVDEVLRTRNRPVLICR